MAKAIKGTNNANDEISLFFECPACKGKHRIVTHGQNAWGFNGNYDSPTITPSIKVVYDTTGGQREYVEPQYIIGVNICHSFITDGKIAFCGDSTHTLAGQTVELPEID